MQSRLIEYFSNQRILILGFGREGQSSYRLIRRLLPGLRIGIADKRDDLVAQFPELTQDSHLDVFCGAGYLSTLRDFDLIMKSPGIPMSELPGLEPERIESQASVFIRLYRDRIIGISGTKGKSTTTTLLWNILRQQYPDTLLVGNMGIPPFDIFDQLKTDTWITYELSSHQLEKLRVAPRYAVLLNIFQEHLDHYSGYEAYQQAKMNLVRYQEKGDYLIYCRDNALLDTLCQEYIPERRVYAYSQQIIPRQGAYSFDERIFFKTADGQEELLYTLHPATPLRGRHNVMNIMAALSIARVLKLTPEHIADGVDSFSALPHRLEYCGLHHGIHFYNDSIATIPEASLEAIRALGKVDTLILGGKDRGIDYSILLNSEELQRIKTLIFMGEAGARMAVGYSPDEGAGQEIILAEDFGTVVEMAIKKTAAGAVCLLSPAAASYDWFYNFEERGDIFRRLIQQA